MTNAEFRESVAEPKPQQSGFDIVDLTTQAKVETAEEREGRAWQAAVVAMRRVANAGGSDMDGIKAGLAARDAALAAPAPTPRECKLGDLPVGFAWRGKLWGYDGTFVVLRPGAVLRATDGATWNCVETVARVSIDLELSAQLVLRNKGAADNEKALAVLIGLWASEQYETVTPPVEGYRGDPGNRVPLGAATGRGGQ
jgi:hypothetical protein